jgi:hypothetical protein
LLFHRKTEAVRRISNLCSSWSKSCPYGNRASLTHMNSGFNHRNGQQVRWRTKSLILACCWPPPQWCQHINGWRVLIWLHIFYCFLCVHISIHLRMSHFRFYP